MTVVLVSAACSLWPSTRSRRSALRAPPCFLVSGLEVLGGRRPRSRRRGASGCLARRNAAANDFAGVIAARRNLKRGFLVWAPRFPRACDLGRTVERRLAWRRGRRLRRSHRRAPNRELPLIRFRQLGQNWPAAADSDPSALSTPVGGSAVGDFAGVTTARRHLYGTRPFANNWSRP